MAVLGHDQSFLRGHVEVNSVLILILNFPTPLRPSAPAPPQPLELSIATPDHVIVPTTAYNNMVFVKGWAERFPRATFWGLEGVELQGAKFTRDLTMEVRHG